jgi:hypothetical protein
MSDEENVYAALLALAFGMKSLAVLLKTNLHTASIEDRDMVAKASEAAENVMALVKAHPKLDFEKLKKMAAVR